MQDPHSRTPPGAPLTAERRQDPRFPVRPTEYIEIGDSNGGIILDISATGMAVATAQALVGNQTLKFRFQLPRQPEPIEASGEIHWIGETRKRAGVRFVDLPDGALAQILRWIAAQNRVAVDEFAAAPPDLGSNGSKSKTAALVDAATSQEFLKSPAPGPQPRNGHAAGQAQVPEPAASLEDAEDADFDLEPIYETPSRQERTERPPQPERRAQTRRAPTDSTYVEVDDGNAGLIGDLSATGLSLRAAKTLESDKITVRFQVPGSQELVDARAWIVWKSASQKKAGARFEDLPEEARKHIVEWIDGKAPAAEKGPAPGVVSEPKTAEVAAQPVTPKISLLAPDSVPIPAYISPITQKVIVPPVVAAANPVAKPVEMVPPAASESPKKLPTAPPARITTPVVSEPAPPIAAKPPVPALSPNKPLAPVVPAKPPAPAAVRPSAAPVAAVPATPARLDVPAPLVPSSTPSPFATKSSVPSLVSPPLLGNPNATLPGYSDSTWYLAPKKRFGFWKVATLLAVVAGLAVAGNYAYRSRQATPPNNEVAQKQGGGASSANEADIPEPEDFAPEKGSGAGSEPGKNAAESAADPAVSRPTQPQASAASPAATTTSPVKRDTPKIKSDDQFVDEPRQPKFVDEPRRPAPQPPVQTSQQTSQPPLSSAVPVVRDNSNSNRAQTASPAQSAAGTQPAPRPSIPASGNGTTLNSSGSNPSTATTPANSTAGPSRGISTQPAPASPTLNSSGSQGGTSANPPAGNASPRDDSSTATASPISTPAGTASAGNGATAAPSTAPAQNPVGTVSFFSRFRAIRSRGDILNGGAPNAGGMLQIGALASSPVPAYPPEALRQQIQGLVELDVSVAADGTVQSVHLVRGPAELAVVAMNAVRGWRYSPTMLGGKAVEAQQSVFFTFKLGK